MVGADAEGAPRGAPSDEAHASPERAESVSADTAYTIMQVDEHVTRHPWSAAPAYPEELRTRRLEGEVFARYVVDSTGRADPESFEVLSASHPAFAESVRRALPAMAFTPARIGTRAVRQLVEQRFAFRLLAEPVQAARSGAAGPPGTPPPGN